MHSLDAAFTLAGQLLTAKLGQFEVINLLSGFRDLDAATLEEAARASKALEGARTASKDREQVSNVSEARQAAAQQEAAAAVCVSADLDSEDDPEAIPGPRYVARSSPQQSLLC
jgi:hypothetical protein